MRLCLVKILLCGILFLNVVFANNFVFNEDSIFVEKSVSFVENVSSELFSKTGVRLYIFIESSLKNESYNDFKSKIITRFESPYAAIILIKDDKKIDIFTSSDNILSLKDRKKIYWEYMIPLIPNKDNEITTQALSAVILNGYVESVDLIADKFGVEIIHNIPKDEKGAKFVAKTILYIMLFSMLGIMLVIYLFRNKFKNQGL